MSRPSADTLSFTPTHTFLNPKFESYKLSAPSPSLASSDELISQSFPLPGGKAFETPRLPDHARLSYNEVGARARYNHLSGGRGGEVVWVDGREGEVWAVEVDKKTAQPTFHSLGKLPSFTSSSSPSTPSTVPEYPTALPLAPYLWAISSGRGTLHLLRIDPSSSSSWTGTFEGSLELRDGADEAELTPFRLHAANILPQSDGKEAIVLLSKVVKSATSSASSSAADPATTAAFDSNPSSSSTAQAKTRLKLASHTSFEYLSCRIPLPASSGETQPLSVDWRLQGDDLPAFVEFDAEEGRYCIGAGAVLKPVGSAKQESKPDASSEMDVDSSAAAADTELLTASEDAAEQQSSAASAPSIPKPPPFSWLQDRDSLTVAFPIPSDTPTSSIRITFSRQYLSLFVASPRAAAASSTPFAGELPKLSHKKLWGDIDPHTSVWTFDREAEGRNSTFGLLTLHLEKAHAGTKWPDVFAPTASSSREEGNSGGEAKIVELSGEEEYENVQETVDPSELAAVAEKMEQWAQGIVQSSSALGGGGNGDGLGSGLPSSLVGDEMDVEVDAESGRAVVLNWVEGAMGKKVDVVTPHRTIPYSLLSTALPLASSSSSSFSSSPISPADPTITIKHDVDALLFSPPFTSSTSPSSYAWQHLSTFPALAFVLATKRDTRFVYHLRSNTSPALLLSAGAVLAFDAPAVIPGPSSTGSIGKGGGNLFVYISPPAGSKAQTGRSMVSRVGSGVGGAVVGTVGVELECGEVAVLVLCESELVVLRIFAA